MKRMTLALVLFAVSFCANAFTGKPDNAAIPASFYRTFNNAQQVQSQVVNEMIRVSFIADGHASFAYYDSEGQLVVSSTQLREQELPVRFREDLVIRFNQWFVADVYQCKKNGVTDYYVVLQQDGKELILKASPKGWKKFSEKATK